MILSILISLLTVFAGIVPQPESITPARGEIRISGAAFKCDSNIDAETFEMISDFAGRLSFASGRTSPTSKSFGLASVVEAGKAKGVVFLYDASKAAEEYQLDVTRRAVVVRASAYNGFLYAIQTIKQMLPADIYAFEQYSGNKWVLPCCTIKDKPRYAYRGLLLDCARHYIEMDEIKRVLDVMAVYKLNRFHWHITEDQGWRIEIKKYPLLTEKGSVRKGTQRGHDFSVNDGVPYGGYYTQDDAREIVAYAGKLGITVVPEIDLPGHMLAALACYPELGCTGGPYEVGCQWGVQDDVLCPGKEGTFKFIEDVLGELCEIFPGEYFHIGGDECPKVRWHACPDCQARIKELGLKDDGRFSAEQYLQNYVTKRVQDFLATKGKKIIGWEEILEGDLKEGATVMSWTGTKAGIEASARDFDVIMSPASHCYIDYCQYEDPEKEPLCIGAYLPIERCYDYEPTEGMKEGSEGHILGVQVNLWGEYVGDREKVEYMLLPRMIASSEVQWCQPSVKNYGRFRDALINHQFKVLDAGCWHYSRVIEGIHGYWWE